MLGFSPVVPVGERVVVVSTDPGRESPLYRIRTYFMIEVVTLVYITCASAIYAGGGSVVRSVATEEKPRCGVNPAG